MIFIEERHQAILELLQAAGRFSICEIENRFQVSADSARRYLRIKEEKGLLKRTHGGAHPLRQIAAGRPPKQTVREMAEVKDNYLAIAL